MQLSKLVGLISQRPKMFLKSESINELSVFMAGYCFCLDELGSSAFPAGQELQDFSKWLRDRDRNLSENEGWENFLSGKYGDSEGYKKFFEYWERFKADAV